jgi:hypothetical protein|tara:strand:+ start:1420 stop:2127 length:708 start_codon:yes stop_codon:yes gene_type:complete
VSKFNNVFKISKTIRILTTTKKFGNKDNFNLSYDQEQPAGVKENLQYLCKNFLPAYPYFVKQVHGNKISNVDIKNYSYVADGIITREKNKVIAIKTADCIPIVIYSTCSSIICILHAGRKGIEYNIIKNAFKILGDFGFTYGAWIGPCISKNNYIVGQDVKNTFINIDKRFSKYFLKKNDKYCMDIIGIAKLQLNDCNISNISLAGLCTFENSDLFYSYRRGLDKGRFGTFCWIE